MKDPLFVSLALAFTACSLAAEPATATNMSRVRVPALTNTYWWAGIIDHGYQMPLADGYAADLCGDTYGNQAQPLLL